ncbi:peroxisomal N(1)-acetyl-spermine/spermidine oxidase-like isoform X1 [Melanotaenia boesemani]|uniref:peroxisomal N(1)-acetyl-spermine/spermidine oxidase-like isoform X1 n=1 Tax=Melanotaenia boesemani TaxID=1250792 RepID=UPI001C0423BF|nr:peroxisomal N(1)-acetyl-spermine/spermidine oxidase-like isoform X1 [Melanotaenia boesemani]
MSLDAAMAQSVNANVVVVGCGISGVAAAHRLVKAGFNNVRILEATSRSGGRIKTGKLGNIITEIGATYLHGPSEKNPVFCLARDYGLLGPEALTPENQAIDVDEYPPWVPNWFSSSGQRLSAESMSPALELFHEVLDNTWQFRKQKERSGASVGHYIRSKAPKRALKKWKDKDEPTKKLLLSGISAMLKVECCASATHTMDDIDLVGYSMYKSIKGVDCTFPSGYDGLISHLMSELPPDLVTYNRPVRCVHWNGTEGGVNPVTVECDDGERIAADHVILTVPLGYLKKHHSTLFSPPLPTHKLDSIHQLGFGTCDKIYVEFESPWWDADCEVIYLVWKDEENISDQVSDKIQSWTRKIPAFTVIKPSEKGSHVLCGWIAGLEAEYMETLPEEEIRRSITELIYTFTGDRTITPKRILCTRWFNDPWTCGSYCHPALRCSAKDLQNMKEPLPVKGKSSQPLQVLFAGEATHPCYYSTVHGALQTGWREADRLISHHLSGSLLNQSGQKVKV